jgi:hypothetical protein
MSRMARLAKGSSLAANIPFRWVRSRPASDYRSKVASSAPSSVTNNLLQQARQSPIATSSTKAGTLRLGTAATLFRRGSRGVQTTPRIDLIPAPRASDE